MSAGGKQHNKNAVKPRKSSVIYNYEKSIAASFKADCENFLEEFEKLHSFKYDDFASVWQSKNFTYIFANQDYVSVLKALCETCYYTVKKYIMFQESLYLKIGAFYLLYGLYYEQPIQNLVKIRLTLEEYKQIEELMDIMNIKRQLDALYIFVKMKSDNAFLYVARPKPLTVDQNITKMENLFNDTFETRGTESSLNKFKELVDDTLVKDLNDICTEYTSALKQGSGKYSGLTPFDSSVISQFHSAYKKVFQSEGDVEPEPSTEQSAHLKKQYVLKKAVSNKNAVYRGSRKVLTKADLDPPSDSD